MSVGVMKDYKLKLGSYVSHIHWVVRELEHLKIETRLTIDKLSRVMGVYVTER